MNTSAKFKVDPALAKILGESYTSVESAVKELIDNAFDADSLLVTVTLPQIFENSSIIITDDGDGMTPNEVKEQYLKIASSRSSRKGNVTHGKKRKVKGRKGIGKFAGLTVASIMQIKTKARGQETTLSIAKEDLLGKDVDLESIEMPIVINDCDANEHGTTITLIGLSQNLNFPNPEKLKQLLTREYLRENDFKILVNGDEVSVNDIAGQKFETEIILKDGQKVTAIATLADKQNRYYGLNYRVDGKVVGKPINILGDHEYIPERLQKKLYVEIKADCLLNDTTADWGAINESSRLKEEIEARMLPFLEQSLKEGSRLEMAAAKARHQKKINAYLAKQPEYRSHFAKVALEKVIEKFWSEDDAKIETIISLLIDAFEKGYYWAVVQSIDDAEDNQIEKLAEAFNDFGLYEITMMTQEASAKAKFLDKLEILINNASTLEATVHQSLCK